MTEMLNAYVGKKCVIYTLNDSVTGVIKAVSEGWATVDTGKEVTTINLDFVIQVKEKKA